MQQNVEPIDDDIVMARWLQSAGLQHLASPKTSPNRFLKQGLGMQRVEDEEKQCRWGNNLNLEGESEPHSPTASFYAPELRASFGAGLLDLNAMDTGLLSEHTLSESSERASLSPILYLKFVDDQDAVIDKQNNEQTDPSTKLPANEKECNLKVSNLARNKVMRTLSEPSEATPVKHTLSGGFDDGYDTMISQQNKGQADTSTKFPANEKECSSKEGNTARIKVVVRKRPLNKKELSRKDYDIIKVCDNACLTVHEPKQKVDLTAYVEKHEFCFDEVLDENVTNDEVYRVTVKPIVPTLFQRTKATCFAYGQTGSGKTFTMQPLPIRAAEEIITLLHQPSYQNQNLKLWVSYFEIYGGKLFDLLRDRRKLCMREDGRQQVCIVGLQEFEVSNVQTVKEFLDKGNTARVTGSTGVNEESSRSHAILQLAVKKHNVTTEAKKQNDGNETKNGKVVGKISFIDLAGSERGADTYDNARQTRMEGAEINKSLLALKECIRALDNDQNHIPFRGSKLTEVLRDSFVGNSRTIMISCISPNVGSCEHTLNTLRYADRVKSLSKSGTRKDQGPINPTKESSVPPLLPTCIGLEDPSEQNNEVKVDSSSYTSSGALERHSSSSSNYNIDGKQETKITSGSGENYISNSKNSNDNSNGCKSIDAIEDDLRKLISSCREEKPEKQSRTNRKRESDIDSKNHEQLQICSSNSNNILASGLCKQGHSCTDVKRSAMLEEKEALVLAHRMEIEDTIKIVHEEMKLLAEISRSESPIDTYMTQLSFLLSRKAASLAVLQARLAQFHLLLTEQEVHSSKTISN